MYTVKKIDSKETYDFILDKHYAGRKPSISFSYGLFDGSQKIGVLTIGKPASNSLCTGVLGIEYQNKVYELNRLIVEDNLPKNTLSWFVSKVLKDLKKNDLILISYADTGMNHNGYIYQATNWMYIGYLLSDSFYKLDNDVVHAVTVWHRYKEKHPLRETHTTNEILCKTFSYVSKILSKQHVYIFPLKKRVNIPFERKPYPKKDMEIEVLSEVVYKDENGVYLPKGVRVNFTDETLKSVF
jgi:hypothetical protein